MPDTFTGTAELLTTTGHGLPSVAVGGQAVAAAGVVGVADEPAAVVVAPVPVCWEEVVVGPLWAVVVLGVPPVRLVVVVTAAVVVVDGVVVVVVGAVLPLHPLPPGANAAGPQPRYGSVCGLEASGPRVPV